MSSQAFPVRDAAPLFHEVDNKSETIRSQLLIATSSACNSVETEAREGGSTRKRYRRRDTRTSGLPGLGRDPVRTSKNSMAISRRSLRLRGAGR